MQAEHVFSKPFEHDQALFDAALSEFVDKGYEQASINTILQAAGMSKGQFYYHFGNKEGLYLALVGVLIARKQAFMRQVMQPADFQQDIFGILKTQIRYGVAFAREYPAIDRFSSSFIREKGNPIYEKTLTVYNFNENDGIDRLVDAAYERGELRDDLPRRFVRRIVGHLLTNAVDILDADRVADFEGEMDLLFAFMQSGIARQNT